MRRPRIVLPLVAALFVGVACGGETAKDAADESPDAEPTPGAEAAPDRAAAVRPDSTCMGDPGDYPEPTRRVVHIEVVDGDSIAWDPEPVVQPAGRGQIGWRMTDQPSDYGWKVTFKDGDSPLPSATYVDSAGRQAGAPVRRDAECRRYAYTITVWPQDDPSDTLVIDPGADIIPW